MPSPALAARNEVQGDTFRGRLRIVNPDGSAKDLTGATARWALYRGTTAVVGPYEVGTGIVIEGSPTLGVLVVTVADSVTEPLIGSYHQEWRIVDSGGDVQKWIGVIGYLESQLEAAA